MPVVSISAAIIEELLETGSPVRLSPGFSLERLQEFARIAKLRGVRLEVPASQLSGDALLILSRLGREAVLFDFNL
jgi:hypothetical protein